MKRLRPGQNGFTVLELLIVVVVVAIIAVLIIPNLTSGPARSRDTQRKTDLRSIKTALETYYSDNNSYPSAQAGSGAASCTPSAANCLAKTLTTGNTPYITRVPNDPKKGWNYIYTPSPSGCTSGACISYTLTAHLENTKDPQAINGVYTLNSAN